MSGNLSSGASPVVESLADLLNEPGEERGGDRVRILLESMEAANNCIVIADPNQDDLPLIYVNRGFRRVTGYDAEDALNRNCRFLQEPPPDVAEPVELDNYDATQQERELEVLRSGLEEHEPCVGLLRNYRRDGVAFWNELYLTPVLKDGQCIAIIGVQNDVTDRVNAQSRLQEVQEQERRRLATDLHDTVAQDLNALTLRAQLLEAESADGAIDRAGLAGALKEITAYAAQAAKGAREISHRLMPSVDGDSDLPDALRDLVRKSGQVWSIECRFKTDGRVGDVPHETMIHLTRVVQEAIANAVRHGRAEKVVVTLRGYGDGVGEQRPGLQLSIRDNGRGLPQFDEQDHVGIGIRTMRNRSRLVGGSFELRNGEEGIDGTEVLVTVESIGHPRFGGPADMKGSRDGQAEAARPLDVPGE